MQLYQQLIIDHGTRPETLVRYNHARIIMKDITLYVVIN